MGWYWSKIKQCGIGKGSKTVKGIPSRETEDAGVDTPAQRCPRHANLSGLVGQSNATLHGHACVDNLKSGGEV